MKRSDQSLVESTANAFAAEPPGHSWPITCGKVPSKSQLRFRRELREVIDAEFLFNSGDLIDHFLKAFRTEQLIFFLLEIFAEGIVFVGRY